MPPSARVTTPASVLRQSAAYYEREGHALFARSEDLLAMATEFFEKARELRSEAEDLEAVDEAKEHWGKNVRLVKEQAA
jgi:hypothetical protein